MKYRRTYFGSKVFIHHYEHGPYPWGFSIQDQNGKLHRFGGIPNKCETEHSALMRAWWRCKWLSNGDFNKRYI